MLIGAAQAERYGCSTAADCDYPSCSSDCISRCEEVYGEKSSWASGCITRCSSTVRSCSAKADDLGLPFSIQSQANGAPAGCIRYNDGRLIFVETCSNHANCGTTNCNGCSVLDVQVWEVICWAGQSCHQANPWTGWGPCAPPPLCAAGKYSLDGKNAGGNKACSNCEAGKTSVSGAQNCTTCASGTYSAAGDSICTNCAAGKSSPAGSDAGSDCTNCAAGKFAAT